MNDRIVKLEGRLVSKKAPKDIDWDRVETHTTRLLKLVQDNLNRNNAHWLVAVEGALDRVINEVAE